MIVLVSRSLASSWPRRKSFLVLQLIEALNVIHSTSLHGGKVLYRRDMFSANVPVSVSLVQAFYYYTHQTDKWPIKTLVRVHRLVFLWRR